jgi:hypothetical protein
MRNLSESSRLLKIRYDLDAARVIIKINRLKLILKQFNPNQPRVPSGQREGGQWTGTAADSDAAQAGENLYLASQSYSWGTLVTEIPKTVGRYCIYQFDFGLVRVEGPTNFSCQDQVPSSAVSHGILLNDNFRR